MNIVTIVNMNMCEWIHYAQSQHDLFACKYNWADWVRLMEDERHRKNMKECLCDTCLRVNKRKRDTLPQIKRWLRFCRDEKLDPAELQYRYHYYPSVAERNYYEELKKHYGAMMTQYLNSMMPVATKKEMVKHTNWCLQCEVGIEDGLKYCGGDDCVCPVTVVA